MTELKINITNLDEIGKDYTFPIESTWLAEKLGDCDVRSDAKADAGEVNLHVQKNGNDYLVTGHLRADVIAECYRCLEDTPVHVQASIASLFTAVSSGKKLPADDDVEDQLDYETFSGHELVLDNLVREHILLEVPMQPLCKEDCAGIPIPEHIKPPADFGREEGDIDPRLAPLKKLAQAKGNKE